MIGLAAKNCYKLPVRLKKRIVLYCFLLSTLNPQAICIACFEVFCTDSDLLLLLSGSRPMKRIH